MIYSIRGELVERTVEGVVIDHNGMGIMVYMPAADLAVMPGRGSEVTLYTHFHVKEDAMTLYGFKTKRERELFEMLITVSGIGPKGGLSILSMLSVDDICFAVMADDSKTISRAQGIGPKTAKKLIVELKDKIGTLTTEDGFENFISGIRNEDKEEDGESMEVSDSYKKIKSDATQALIVLGYTPTEAMKAVNAVEVTEDMDDSEVVKEALKHI